jgi:hypothetical protein
MTVQRFTPRPRGLTPQIDWNGQPLNQKPDGPGRQIVIQCIPRLRKKTRDIIHPGTRMSRSARCGNFPHAAEAFRTLRRLSPRCGDFPHAAETFPTLRRLSPRCLKFPQAVGTSRRLRERSACCRTLPHVAGAFCALIEVSAQKRKSRNASGSLGAI